MWVMPVVRKIARVLLQRAPSKGTMQPPRLLQTVRGGTAQLALRMQPAPGAVQHPQVHPRPPRLISLPDLVERRESEALRSM